jgi:hypothetical protein
VADLLWSWLADWAVPAKALDIHHEESPDCPCGPTPHLEQGPGGDVWVYTHHRLDGSTS